MSDDLDDLRRETRKFSAKNISVTIIDQSTDTKSETFLCRSEDISAGGMKIISHCPLAMGHELPMEIDLGEMWAVIEVVAEVKWCLEIDDAPTFYIGIKLIKVEQENLQVWRKFVEML
jgi:hypothetical protein